MKRIASRKLLTVALLAVAASATVALAGGLPFGRSATPSGYDKFLVYMANGTYNPVDPNYQAPSGDYFQRTIMRRTSVQIDQQQQAAKAFFKDRLGLDAANGDVAIQSFMFDPRNDYRAYVIGGEQVPAAGLVVRDGGFSATTTKDTVLRGTYGGAAGKNVPAGATVVFGDYNIQRIAGSGKHRGDRNPKPLILHYQSEFPISGPSADGVRQFRCELIDPLTGEHGVAQGVIAPPRDAGSGNIQVSIRNVITFPAY